MSQPRNSFFESTEPKDERLAALKQLYPELFADGKLNLDVLKEITTGENPQEARTPGYYGLYWPNKHKAKIEAKAKPTGTLEPVAGDGVNEDTTHNIYIEGENLEVLRILKESYKGRVKMIYIDPPYNTGNDFIYPDNYRMVIDEYLKMTGQVDEKGTPLTSNKKTDGAFHTKWLEMMLPRLMLARELLTEDGVIFISIDDNEQANLKLLCDEVFGEENFIANLIWNTEGHTDNQFDIKVNHEYILCFTKKIDSFIAGFVIDPNTRTESNLWKGFAENSITKNGPANPISEITLPKGFPCKLSKGVIKNNLPDKCFFTDVQQQKYISRVITEKYSTSYPIRFTDMQIENYRLMNDCKVLSGWANANKLKSFIENGCSNFFEGSDECSFYLSENGVIYYYKKREKARNIVSVLRNLGTTEAMRSELEKQNIFFSFPKPQELLNYLIKIGNVVDDSIILDFFSGSATTAHATMQLNAQDNGKRKFIMVQIQQPCDENSEAAKAGYKNIAEIGKERIRRAGKQIREENALAPDLDTGFRVYRLAETNFKPYTPVLGQDENAQKTLFAELENQTTPLVSNWKPENLLTEIILRQGFALDCSCVKCDNIENNTVYRLIDSEGPAKRTIILFVCLDTKIEESTIKTLTLTDGEKFVCLDSAIDDTSYARLCDKGRIETI